MVIELVILDWRLIGGSLLADDPQSRTSNRQSTTNQPSKIAKSSMIAGP
jgi:hypothetical protein